METLLLAGIPISKVDILRPLLEKYGQRLTSSSHMNDLIPVVLDKEKEKLKAELNIVREASIIFDGTARLGEALVDPTNIQYRRHLLDIFESPQELQLLKLELAVGDGPLIFTCFEQLSAVQHAVAVGHFPCLEATAREIAGGNAALHNRLITEAKACVQPGLNFFREKFNIQFISNVCAFKAARFCCPVQVTALRPDARSLEELKNFPFVNDAMVAALATELPLYIAAADGLVCNNEKEKLTWWAAHQDTLPQWSALVRKGVTCAAKLCKC